MASDPHAELRDLIAAKIREAHERPYLVRDGQDADDVFFAHLAAAVLELFPKVGVDLLADIDGDWYRASISQMATHRRYVLTTAPQRIEGDTDG